MLFRIIRQLEKNSEKSGLFDQKAHCKEKLNEGRIILSDKNFRSVNENNFISSGDIAGYAGGWRPLGRKIIKKFIERERLSLFFNIIKNSPA